MFSNKNFWSDVLTVGVRNIWLFTKAEFKAILLIYCLFALGLSLLGYQWAWLIALGISILDVLPVIGAGIVFIPWVIIEWVSGNPSQGWWLLLLYVVVEVIQQLVGPYFLGKDLDLPFWLPIVVILACTLIFNVFGLLVSSILLPFIAAYRQVSKQYRGY